MPISDNERRLQTRLALVDEHIGMENRHDLDGIMRTFGAAARYNEEPWDDHHIGRDAVRAYYDGLLRAMPDLAIDVRERHAAEAAVILEVIVSGHHRGPWRGLPPTGYPVRFPLCGVFTFDDANRLAGERIYYDRATVLRRARRLPRAGSPCRPHRYGADASVYAGARRRQFGLAAAAMTRATLRHAVCLADWAADPKELLAVCDE